MNIVIISDAWHPQINGVVRTLTETRKALIDGGHKVLMVTPEQFRTIPCPSYPEIRLAINPGKKIASLLDTFKPSAIHIATEGTLGWAARRYCLKHKLPFTTAYHTRFPEYVHLRWRIPLQWSYAMMRRFHRPAQRVMVPTRSIADALAEQGIRHTAVWGRGVDGNRFQPGFRDILRPHMTGCEEMRPVFMCIGRVAPEKNLEAFLRLDLPGSKWVIGDGPALPTLQAAYPDVHFLGARAQKELPPYYRAADVFVFPSKTDTFGLVLLEAMACGTPVAAFPVAGPLDVVTDPRTGILDADLRQACIAALDCDRNACADYAAAYTWQHTTQRFFELLEPFQAL
ncbi:glycosyltransferase family 1 protein [Cardiobacteriaceae bacterium TAE3-ERU3]|nr:glycosyltransferase family 1 protein [Cardiobacteriaceae bacterium TAE3-ERU3]